LGLSKLKDRENRNSEKLKKTDFMVGFKPLLEKIKRLHVGYSAAFGEIIFQGTNGAGRVSNNGEYKLLNIQEWKVIFLLQGSSIKGIFPLFRKLNRPSQFSFTTTLGSKVHQRCGVEWILQRFCFFSIFHVRDEVVYTEMENAHGDGIFTAEVKDDDDHVKKYGLLRRTDELVTLFDDCESPLNSKQLMPLSLELKKEAANWTLNNVIDDVIIVAHQSTLPGLVGFLIEDHVKETVSKNEDEAISLALRAVQSVFKKDESPNTISAQSKRQLHSEIMFDSFKHLKFTKDFPYRPKSMQRLYLVDEINSHRRSFLEARDDGTVMRGTFSKISHRSSAIEVPIPTQNHFSLLTDDVDPSLPLLTENVVTTLKEYKEERKEILIPGAITHTLELTVESK
jgi:hypothetical protein